MNIRLRQISLLLIAGLIAFPATAQERVPFRALIHTMPIPVGSCGDGCLELDISGTGQATHMGRTEIQGPSQVDVICASRRERPR